MATTISRVGYGQVEPNHLSAQRTGQIYAQLPADSSISLLENGQFVKYDYANGVVDFAGKGEWMLVFNEIKLYDVLKQQAKDFAMIASDYAEGGLSYHEGMGDEQGQMYPRVFKLNVGDIYTTNCVGGANTSNTATYEGLDLEVGDTLSPIADTGYLSTTGDETITLQVVKIYTMPDGQPAVKLMRIA